MNNSALRNLSYGLFVVTSAEEGRDNGCITNTVMQVTTTPNRIVVAINKNNYTHGMVHRSHRLNVSILSEKATFDIFKHWGFQSGSQVDKTVGVELQRAPNGVVYLTEGVNAVITAYVVDEVDMGTHTLFVADVVDEFVFNEDPSATYSYYHAHIKPAPNAPKSKGWICTICGYIYEGDPLPEDFICPICKHPASDFKRAE